MGRPNKTGLGFFDLNTDVEHDDKISFIEDTHGIIGFGIVVKLWCKVYSEGYFSPFQERHITKFSKKNHIQTEKTMTVLNDILSEGIFDKGLWEKFGILTSRGIQKRFFAACYRRTKIEVVKDFLLMEPENKSIVYVDKNSVIASKNEVSASKKAVSASKKYTEEKRREEKRRKDTKVSLSGEKSRGPEINYRKELEIMYADFQNVNRGSLLLPIKQHLQYAIDQNKSKQMTLAKQFSMISELHAIFKEIKNPRQYALFRNAIHTSNNKTTGNNKFIIAVYNSSIQREEKSYGKGYSQGTGGAGEETEEIGGTQNIYDRAVKPLGEDES
jgi:hypothetical protein